MSKQERLNLLTGATEVVVKLLLGDVYYYTLRLQKSQIEKLIEDGVPLNLHRVELGNGFYHLELIPTEG